MPFENVEHPSWNVSKEEGFDGEQTCMDNERGPSYEAAFSTYEMSKMIPAFGMRSSSLITRCRAGRPEVRQGLVTLTRRTQP